MNWFNFQRVTKDELFHRCGDPIRELFEDQGRVVSGYYNDFLHFQLGRMIRGYAQELTQTEGKLARLAGGLALGGQGESVAVLQWFVREFVGLARGEGVCGSAHRMTSIMEASSTGASTTNRVQATRRARAGRAAHQ